MWGENVVRWTGEGSLAYWEKEKNGCDKESIFNNQLWLNGRNKAQNYLNTLYCKIGATKTNSPFHMALIHKYTSLSEKIKIRHKSDTFLVSSKPIHVYLCRNSETMQSVGCFSNEEGNGYDREGVILSFLIMYNLIVM